MEGKTGEVLKEGKENKVENKEESKGGGGEDKDNILIIIILRGRLTF